MRRPETRRQAVALLTCHIVGAWFDLAAECAKAAGRLARNTADAYADTLDHFPA